MSQVVGIGVDVVDVAQMRDLLDGPRGEVFIARTFTAAEILHANGEAERLAVLFAAKEAAFKALGTGWTDGHHAETLHEASGSPKIRLRGPLETYAEGQGVAKLWVSLSTTATTAVAMVVAMG